MKDKKFGDYGGKVVNPGWNNPIPIVIGSTGLVSKTLINHLENCGLQRERIGPITMMLQRKALLGSLKIVKTAMKM